MEGAFKYVLSPSLSQKTEKKLEFIGFRDLARPSETTQVDFQPAR